MLNKIIAIVLIATIGCSVKNPHWVENIKRDDYKMVRIDIYPYMELPIRGDTLGIGKLREKVEKFPELINKIVHHFYPEEVGAYRDTPLPFKYKCAFIHKDEVTLRYFYRFTEPEIFAGYSIQFVTTNGVIREIYLFKVPLE